MESKNEVWLYRNENETLFPVFKVCEEKNEIKYELNNVEDSIYSFCKVDFFLNPLGECEVKDIYTIVVPGDSDNPHMTMTVSTEEGSPFVYVFVKNSNGEKIVENNYLVGVPEICVVTRGNSEIESDDYIDQTTLVNQIKQVIVEYDTSTEIIDARTFYEEQKDNILTWSQFRKVNLPRCFVSVKFLKKRLNLDESTCIVIKTLENNSGITIKASDDKVIMIGVNGECYDMPGEKFDELYQIVDPDVKIIELSKNASTYEMQPKAFIQGKSEVDLLDFASVCKSRKTNMVYACKKSKNVKVFSTRISGTNQYYYGNGEKKPFYLTVDKDSPTSVHVVDREVFEKSYELVKL